MIRKLLIVLPLVVSSAGAYGSDASTDGFAYRSADPQAVAQQSRTITERLVDVGGFQMQVRTGGPQPSEGGPPLVVFENGRSGIAGTWAEVAEEVASFAPFLAYNRGGRGLSEWYGEPPTPEHVARRLRDLLDVLDLSPPYLLVGHSWGANSGHDIQQDEAELVIEAIRWVLSRMPSPGGQSTGNVEVIPVAPPTGEKEIDRASILAALERVRPGDTVQFAAGTYRVGESVGIATPRIALLGHAGGTVLRGCDPVEQEEVEQRAVRALESRDQDTYRTMRRRCGLLELTGGNVTVRGLTFEHARTGLVLGCCEGDEVSEDGGYLVEDNTFRNSANGIRASLVAAESTVIRGNRFVNVFHALSAGVSRVHMLDNDISVPEPERVPGTGHPGFAIGIRPPPPGPAGGPGQPLPVCEQNVIAGNRIEGHTDGILLRAFEPGTSCRDNTIRNNVIQVRRVRFPVPWLYAGLLPLTTEVDTTFVGVPLGLINAAARAGDADRKAGRNGLENNLILGNHVIGAEGVGIEILDASRNRIADNTLIGIRRRDPFPGNVTRAQSQDWGEANGSGIWISPGSDGNEILGNTFEDITSYSLVIEGDSNHVEVRTDADAVRDLGTGNRVDAPGTTTRHPDLGKVGYESNFVQVRGIRMHYVDFGGSGLPVIFIHGSHSDARSFVDFAPRFADAFRVLALDRRGFGESEDVDWGHGTAAQAEDVLGFMDELGIERAVLIDGNVGLTTYLGEHHPDRLAGIIFLRHMAPEVESRRDSAAAVFWDMASRAACDWDEETRQRNTQRDGYRPHFIDDPDFRIDVPALSLANADGTRHPADFDGVGIFLEQVETGEWCDTTAKEYFSALAADTARATELRNRLGDLTGEANLSAFERAFGPRMTVVRLGVPAVTSYEYLWAPDLIYPHIRTFLEELAGGDP